MSRFSLEDLTLERLGAQDMTVDELREFAEHLRVVAGWLEEIRILRLQHERAVLGCIGHRPTIGYYLQLRRDSS